MPRMPHLVRWGKGSTKSKMLGELDVGRPSSSVVALYGVARRFENGNPAVLRIDFGDLIRAHETTVRRIRGHLGEEPSVHLYPLRFLNPSASQKNVGIWRSHPRPGAIRRIESQLGEYCALIDSGIFLNPFFVER